MQTILRRYERTLRERERLDAMYVYERAAAAAGHTLVAGVDEAGRGPLAGPVAVAAVILPQEAHLPRINDSKKLSAAMREELFTQIVAIAISYHVALIDAETITGCLDSVKIHGNAVTTTPAIETIFVQEETGEVGQIFNRSRCAMARALQCFYLTDLYETHLRAQAEGRYDFIDSAMMMQHYGAELHTVTGPVENIKITTPTDFYLFRALLDAKENMQIVGL